MMLSEMDDGTIYYLNCFSRKVLKCFVLDYFVGSSNNSASCVTTLFNSINLIMPPKNFKLHWYTYKICLFIYFIVMLTFKITTPHYVIFYTLHLLHAFHFGAASNLSNPPLNSTLLIISL